MYHFTRGLYYKTREKVEISNPRNLQDLMDEAIRLDSYELERQRRKERYNSQRYNRNEKTEVIPRNERERSMVKDETAHRSENIECKPVQQERRNKCKYCTC